MSTLIELVTQVRDEIIEPLTGLVSDSEIKRWLNDSNSDLVDAIVTEAGGLESATPNSIATVAGTEWYDLNADFGTALRVERLGTDGVSWYTMIPSSIQGRQANNGGIPTSYYLFAGKMGIIPVPNDVYSLRAFYHKRAVDMVADASTPTVDARWHRLLYTYGVSQAKRKADDPAFNTYVSDYLAARTQMIRTILMERQGNQSFRMIRDVG